MKGERALPHREVGLQWLRSEEEGQHDDDEEDSDGCDRSGNHRSALGRVKKTEKMPILMQRIFE